MQPKVSVIIPVYKVEKYLDECLESVVNQTYKDFEVILVDDGSPDNCPLMCDNWAIRDARIKVIHQPNQGISTVRNKGIENSIGEYILFIDSDDFIDKTAIEKALTVAEKTSADIVCFGVFRITENKEIIEATEKIKNNTVSRQEALLDLCQGNVHDYSWNKLYRRKVFEGVYYPTDKTIEDIATTYKLFLNAEKISYLSDELYFYRRREGSIIADMKSSTLNDLFLVRKERYEFLKSDYPEASEACFELTAIAALNFYDRALWDSVNPDTLNAAIAFLKSNKSKASEINAKMKLYFTSPTLYNLLRKTKHFIGNVIKAIKNK